MGFDIPSPGSRDWGRFRQEGGFTLVEVLLAILLLCLVALTVQPMFVLGAKAQKKAEVGVQAFNYARQQMEAKVNDVKSLDVVGWPSSGSTTPLFEASDLRMASAVKPPGTVTGTFSFAVVPVILEGKTVSTLGVTMEMTYDDNTANTGKRTISLRRVITPGV